VSYDVSLTIDTGGPEPADVGSDHNMTSNVACMWRHAGCNLAECDGKTAADMLPMLAAAIAKMRAEPATYRAMNAPNGWGTYEGCLGFMERLHADWTAHPKATIRVSR
jgi:hypothetical protein